MKPLRTIIFAKAPEPGYAKTRLIPALGSEGAANLARRMLLHTVETALAAKLGTVELCVAPSLHAPIWQTLALPASVQMSEQGEGDLGMRMARASQRAIAQGQAVVLIGTDCPALDCAVLQHAALALQQADATLVPTADGGYALLGFKQFQPSLFADIAWSTATVASTSLARIQSVGWSVVLHAVLHDIDEPSDLQYLPRGWQERGNE